MGKKWNIWWHFKWKSILDKFENKQGIVTALEITLLLNGKGKQNVDYIR